MFWKQTVLLLLFQHLFLRTTRIGHTWIHKNNSTYAGSETGCKRRSSSTKKKKILWIVSVCRIPRGFTLNLLWSLHKSAYQSVSLKSNSLQYMPPVMSSKSAYVTEWRTSWNNHSQVMHSICLIDAVWPVATVARSSVFIWTTFMLDLCCCLFICFLFSHWGLDVLQIF